jgi:hydrogenase expression/formation protein HypD
VKYLDEYRQRELIEGQLEMIAARVRSRWTIMEVCGGQTHAILKHGIDRRLPENISLLHGPGCPVCVTPAETIDQAIEIARHPVVILCSFGDMLRVPGAECDMLTARAQGADIRMVYTPLEAVALAKSNPDREVVFFAIGFETTAPVVATSVLKAENEGLTNFSILAAQVRIPPAIAAILEMKPQAVDAFLAPGHVCTVTGADEYVQLVERYRVPVVITGFEPVDLLQGIYSAVDLLEQGEAKLENQYRRAVRNDGNTLARERIERVFETVDRSWRGLGVIPKSGYALREPYAAFDAIRRFRPGKSANVQSDVYCGRVLSGGLKPVECPFFGSECHPGSPVGPCMVSSEGACAAYYRYGERRPAAGG